MHLKSLITLILFTPGLISNAQHKLEGRITDSENLLPVVEASIQIQGDNSAFSISDSSGYFAIETTSLPCTLIIRHLSYKLLLYPVNASDTSLLNPVMQALSREIQEVSVTADFRDNNRQLSEISYRASDIEKMTSGFGDADIIRNLQSMTGIAKSSEINAALNVRGTGHGNNRITFDGQDLHNSYHLLGIAPMFNPDIIESTLLQKSGFSANMGNALSSYLQVESMTPDLYNSRFSVSLCNLSAKLLYEGPIKEGQSSIIASARYSFFDMIGGIYSYLHEDKEGFNPLPEYHLYDLFLKFHLEIKNNWKANLSLFNTSDKFSYNVSNLKLRTDWKNSLISLNLTKTINHTDLLKIHSGVSVYNFDGSYNPSWTILRRNDLLSWDNTFTYSHLPDEGLFWEAGAFNTIAYYYLNSSEVALARTLRTSFDVDYTVLSGLFGDFNLAINDILKIESGLRLSYFHNDTGMLKLSPHIQISAETKSTALNLSYDRTWQFSHLISPLGFNMPADLWYPAGKHIPAQKADQLALQFRQNWSMIESNIGVFFKALEGQSDLATGTEMIAFSPEDVMVFGSGSSYGLETSLKVDFPFLDAGIYYTWSKSKRQFDMINNGEEFSPSYDLPHQIDIYVSGNLGRDWTCTLNWFRASGQIITMPTGFAFLSHGPEAMPYPVYTKRYNFRMPPSHRMDLSISYNSEKDWGDLKITFGVYNLYHNSNPYYMYFTVEEIRENEMEVIPHKMSIFPFTPFASIKITI